MASNPPGPSGKKVHPFFTGPKHAPQSSHDENRNPGTVAAVGCPLATNDNKGKGTALSDTTNLNPRKRGNTPVESNQEQQGQQEPPKKKRGRPPKKPTVSAADSSNLAQPALQDAPLLVHGAQSTQAPKKGKTLTDEPATVAKMDEGGTDDVPVPAAGRKANRNSISSSMEINIRDEAAKKTEPELPPQNPKRMLKLDPTTGTFSAPSSPKPTRATQKQSSKQTTSSPRAKRSPRSKGTPSRPSKIVTVRYGQDEDARVWIGSRIEAILNGKGSPRPATPKKATPASKGGKKSAAPVKVTHPFFSKLGQKGSTAAPLTDSPSVVKPSASGPKQFTSTPVSPPKKPKANWTVTSAPQFGIKSTGLRVPGAQHPAWPWKGATHVRGDESSPSLLGDATALPLALRKSKGHATFVKEDENLLALKAKWGLDVPAIVQELQKVDNNKFAPPPRELRLPKKHFENGHKLQKRVAKELYSNHPAVTPLSESISTNLSAFDRVQCESVAWTQKYAPGSAAEVVQSGREAFIIKEWLAALKVQAVDKGPGDSAASSAKPKASGDVSKKKRKKTKLDGFIVDSDDEGDDAFAESENEGDWAPSGRHGISKPTVVRAKASSLSNDGRLANAIVISGPYGCGKTAAVYAVAKELGFEVFEINPSSKRGNKDVTERIGDMTRNHLVQHNQTAKVASEPEAIVHEDVQDQINSGKQPTMASFFQPKPAQQSKPKKGSKPSQKLPAQTAQVNKPATSQKQSLILLEEVDLLYEEDRTFWTAVTTLMAQSKRPFIMTCNVETLVPLHTLNLHAILRFTSPPVDIAVERLIAIAANEGHALKRPAVESLFESRGRDFRGTLMDLQYWCQIGIGDRRGGVDWSYMRLPKGVDIDEDGLVVRVVSEDTYQEGMCWGGRDTLIHANSQELDEEHAMSQTGPSHKMDVGHWHDNSAFEAWMGCSNEWVPENYDGPTTLRAYEDFADSMSLGDIMSVMAFASGNKQLIDATLPDMPSKSRDDYIIGLQLLETPSVEEYNSLRTQIPTYIMSAGKKTLKTDSDSLFSSHYLSDAQHLIEAETVEMIYIRNSQKAKPTRPVGRIDFALAFDPIASAEAFSGGAYLEASVFDRNFEPIVLDVAPYVRGIVSYDAHLQQQRLKLSNLVSEGGRGPKRLRTTRAAMSALEGGQRSTTRKEKWFKADLNKEFVWRTSGDGWTAAVEDALEELKEKNETKVTNAERQDDEDPDADELG